jgi:uncharacterized membrane protein
VSPRAPQPDEEPPRRRERPANLFGLVGGFVTLAIVMIIVVVVLVVLLA